MEELKFSYPTEKEWQQEAGKQLKGKPLFELNYITDEGISLKPIYFPTDKPLIKSVNPANKMFIAPYLFIENSVFNSKAKEALNNGQTALSMNLDLTSQFADNAPGIQSLPGQLHLTEYEHFEKLFDGIDLNTVPLLFDSYLKFDTLFQYWNTYTAKKGFDPKKVTGSLGADPISASLLYSGLPDEPSLIFEKIASTFKDRLEFSELYIITISADIIHNSGGNAIHELNYTLGCVVFYVQQLAKHGVAADHVLSAIRIKLAVGNEQFKEIAKIRAMRLLWCNLCKAYGINDIELKIDAVTSWRFLSERDTHSNMLRCTSQVFSAIVGGSNSINILPFDLAVCKTDDKSRRVARNTAIILLEECNLNRVNDPSIGSGFIDNLTVDLAQGAWKAFQDMQADGGIFENIKSGKFQSEIEKNAAKQKKEFKEGQKKVIGVNFYRNANEKQIEKSENLKSKIKGFISPPLALEVQPLIISRLDAGYEE